MSIRQRVIKLLNEQKRPLTATEINNALNVPDGISDFIGVELSSVSSALRKMYDAGELRRIYDWGPRGGYGYWVKNK